MSVVIYHNPRCSKSRTTLAILEEKGIAPEVVEYLKETPTEEMLKGVLSMLGMSPRDLMRKGEAVYKEKGLDNENLSEVELVKAMVADPILIERPIVVANGKARIGRPPESVLEIL
ncbi:MAG: arsenate reductase (glutaredoxin) [Alphaproteobacteria bacterium]|nr:MAG: arsenate reductase (glutaredoxin) [Alphaproteobacteria bacterium]